METHEYVDIDKYEEECEKIRKENEALLLIFQDDLLKGKLSEKTIVRHIRNVDFYLNDYLLYYDELRYDEGTHTIDDFLGYFFIRKCMWSTPATIKTTAASIKKFYKCMLEHNKIKKEDYDELCQTIKENMEFWQDDCAKFNDPDAPDPFIFF